MSAVRCPSCGHALLTIDDALFPTPLGVREATAQQLPSGPLLLRVSEAAELLRISRTKLYQLISSSQISVVRLGKSVRVSRQELERLSNS